MKHSSAYIGFTCVSVMKEVRKVSFDELAAEVQSGDTSIEEALQKAALIGAEVAQTHGACKVRARWEDYLAIVDFYVPDEIQAKIEALMLKKDYSVISSAKNAIKIVNKLFEAK
jgi:hypothetical protein